MRGAWTGGHRGGGRPKIQQLHLFLTVLFESFFSSDIKLWYLNWMFGSARRGSWGLTANLIGFRDANISKRTAPPRAPHTPPPNIWPARSLFNLDKKIAWSNGLLFTKRQKWSLSCLSKSWFQSCTLNYPSIGIQEYIRTLNSTLPALRCSLPAPPRVNRIPLLPVLPRWHAWLPWVHWSYETFGNRLEAMCGPGLRCPWSDGWAGWQPLSRCWAPP